MRNQLPGFVYSDPSEKTRATSIDRGPSQSIKAVKVCSPPSKDYVFALDVRGKHGERLGALVIRERSIPTDTQLEICSCAEFTNAEIES